MTNRAQIIALTVLMIALAGVFIAVGDAGVSTNAFSADPTAVPTEAPAVAEAQSSGAENWGQAPTDANVWLYQADPSIQAVIQIDTLTVEQAAIDPNAPAPPLQFLEQLNGQFAQTQLEFGSDNLGIDEPFMRLMGGIPVGFLRLTLVPGVFDQYMDGAELVFAAAQQGTGSDILLIQYSFSAGRNTEQYATIYADFEDWIAANIAELTAPDETAEDTNEEGAPDAAVPDETTPDEGATDATAPDEAGANAVPDSDWIELAEGQLVYAANPNASISYGPPFTLAELEFELELEPLEDGAQYELELYLSKIYDQIEASFTQNGMEVPTTFEDAHSIEEIEGVTVGTLRFIIPGMPAATPDGQAQPGRDVTSVLVPQGDTGMQIVNYMYLGDEDPQIYEAFRTWLADNMSTLAEPAPEPEASEATDEAAPESVDESAETTEDAPADTESTESSDSTDTTESSGE